MAPETELLLKHFRSAKASSALIFNCPDALSASLIAKHMAGTGTVFHNSDFSAHLSIQHAVGRTDPGMESTFGPWYAPRPPGHDACALYLPRERAAVEMSLTMLAGAVRPGAELWLVGRLRAGARAFRSLIEKTFGATARAHTGRHSVLYHVLSPSTEPALASADRWTQTYAFDFLGHSVSVVSLPGVFSHGRLDPGTNMLMGGLTRPPRPTARILDFGCGAGTIGAALKLGWPRCHIDMIDRSALALEASSRTLAANGLTTDNLWPSDTFSHIRERYDLIVSNPPFHDGIRTDHSVAEKLVREAPDHLRPGGKLRIVANRFLRYAPLLKASLGTTQVLTEDGAYRVIEATRKR